WYVGRPVIVTENDYGLGLFNGDLGVVVSTDDGAGMSVVMDAADPGGVRFAVGLLPEVRSAHAMTVHRSQGSQVEEVTVLLPDSDSPLLTRQLLYTAVTRAKARVRVVGSPDAVRTAVGRDVQRASGLAERLATLPTCPAPPPRHPPHLTAPPPRRPAAPAPPGTPTFTALCNRSRFHRTLQQVALSPHFLPRPGSTALLAALRSWWQRPPG